MSLTTLDPHGTALVGPGAIQRLPELVAAAAQRRAFIVSDPGLTFAGVTGSVAGLLGQAGIEVGIFDQIRPNPATEHLDAGARVIRAFGETAVVALGGGAVIDAAKGLALMATNPGTARDVDYRRAPEHPGLPVIAIPTTAGTGSETNAWGVIDDPVAGRKFYVGHVSVLPRFVVLDAELTLTLPPGPTAAAGMDALAHALESLASIRRNPYADALNLEVVRLVFRYLPRAVARGHDLEARSEMLWAAHMAGLAFGSTGLGLGHGLAHAISARIGAPHGVVLAVLLPHVLAFNLPACRDAYARLTESSSEFNDSHGSTEPAMWPNSVATLSAEVGLPATLHQLGLEYAHIPTIVADALADEVLVNTPRYPTSEDLAELLLAAI